MLMNVTFRSVSSIELRPPFPQSDPKTSLGYWGRPWNARRVSRSNDALASSVFRAPGTAFSQCFEDGFSF